MDAPQEALDAGQETPRPPTESTEPGKRSEEGCGREERPPKLRNFFRGASDRREKEVQSAEPPEPKAEPKAEQKAEQKAEPEGLCELGG